MSRATAAPELEYEFDPELLTKLRTLPGKWVVVSEDSILGVGDTSKEALEDAGRPEAPTLIFVPGDHGASYLL